MVHLHLMIHILKSEENDSYVLAVVCCEEICSGYHDSLLPYGEGPAPHSENNIFEEGRALHGVHQAVMSHGILQRFAT